MDADDVADADTDAVTLLLPLTDEDAVTLGVSLGDADSLAVMDTLGVIVVDCGGNKSGKRTR